MIDQSHWTDTLPSAFTLAAMDREQDELHARDALARKQWEALSAEEQAEKRIMAAIQRERRPDPIYAEMLAGVRSLGDVKPTQLDWLWPGWVPFGKLTIVDGDPGLGKSTVLLDIACRASRGTAFPAGGPVHAPFVTLYITAEDDASDTIVPRIIRASGDANMIYVLPRLTLPDDVDSLERTVAQLGARLVILDPLVAFLGDGVRTNEDHKVRRALEPLAEMAARSGIAVIGIRHLNKQSGGAAMYRGGGSIAFTGLARSVIAFGRDPEDDERVVMALVKGNLARKPSSLAFRLDADGPYDPAYVVWEGESHYSAEDLIGFNVDLASDHSKSDKMAKAARAILEANGGDMLAMDGWSALEADGLAPSGSTKTAALRKAGIRSWKDGMDGRWRWSFA